MTQSIRVLAILRAMTLAASVSAHAGDRLAVVSKVFGLDKSQVLDIGVNQKFIAIVSGEVVVSDALDATHPLKNLSGTCGGSIEIKDKVHKGGGYCVYVNSVGGKWLLTWDAHPTDPGGSYQLVGTEGNALGWKGAGKWSQGADFPQGRYYQTWSGWVEKP